MDICTIIMTAAQIKNPSCCFCCKESKGGIITVEMDENNIPRYKHTCLECANKSLKKGE